jgi:CRP-like cAMP-binding protein
MNRLLAALPKNDYLHLKLSCEPVELLINEVLSSTGDEIHHVYFPTSSIISLMRISENERDLEVGMVGNEGMLGCNLLMGINAALFSSVVQKSGSASRISAINFIQELQYSLEFQQLLQRYLYISFGSLVQNSACNRFHVVEERLARLLLMIRDRAQSASFFVTQESLARMLGVRRVGVTKAAGSLQSKMLISYSRGNLKIEDNIGLECASCSCYKMDIDIYKLVMHNQI